MPFLRAVLDLFDAEFSPSDVCSRIDEFLRSHASATDVIVFYVGHGSFLDDQSYFLMLRETAKDREHVSGLRAADLATTLRKGFRKGRTFVILDACFAGSALPYFQGPMADLIDQQALFGVALLNASSKNKAAVVPRGAPRTMFSDCLCDVLSRGIPEAGAHLSLRELQRAIWRRIAIKYPADQSVWPEVHTPRQHGGGDIADTPLFPNIAWARSMTAGSTDVTEDTSTGIAWIDALPPHDLEKLVGILAQGDQPYRFWDAVEEVAQREGYKSGARFVLAYCLNLLALLGFIWIGWVTWTHRVELSRALDSWRPGIERANERR